MAQVVKGRFAARMDGPFVVFMIGMRVNRPLALRKWLPTFRALGPMLRELYKHPEKGFLGAEFLFYWPGVAALQYWRSFEDLERFARNPDDPHLPAWQRFNRAVKSDGSVGIWHESYLVFCALYEPPRDYAFLLSWLLGRSFLRTSPKRGSENFGTRATGLAASKMGV